MCVVMSPGRIAEGTRWRKAVSQKPQPLTSDGVRPASSVITEASERGEGAQGKNQGPGRRSLFPMSTSTLEAEWTRILGTREEIKT